MAKKFSHITPYDQYHHMLHKADILGIKPALYWSAVNQPLCRALHKNRGDGNHGDGNHGGGKARSEGEEDRLEKRVFLDEDDDPVKSMEPSISRSFNRIGQLVKPYTKLGQFCTQAVKDPERGISVRKEKEINNFIGHRRIPTKFDNNTIQYLQDRFDKYHKNSCKCEPTPKTTSNKTYQLADMHSSSLGIPHPRAKSIFPRRAFGDGPAVDGKSQKIFPIDVHKYMNVHRDLEHLGKRQPTVKLWIP